LLFICLIDERFQIYLMDNVLCHSFQCLWWMVVWRQKHEFLRNLLSVRGHLSGPEHSKLHFLHIISCFRLLHLVSAHKLHPTSICMQLLQFSRLIVLIVLVSAIILGIYDRSNTVEQRWEYFLTYLTFKYFVKIFKYKYIGFQFFKYNCIWPHVCWMRGWGVRILYVYCHRSCNILFVYKLVEWVGVMGILAHDEICCARGRHLPAGASFSSSQFVRFFLSENAIYS
jgi:hypothetical protein